LSSFLQGILARVEAEHMKLVGAIATHYHFDHTGGMPPPPFDSLGIRLPGVKEIAEAAHVPVRIGCIGKSGIHSVVTYENLHFVDNPSHGTPLTKKPTSVTWVRWDIKSNL
jgi:hypothetical protein